jgi:hypothetical protein
MDPNNKYATQIDPYDEDDEEGEPFDDDDDDGMDDEFGAPEFGDAEDVFMDDEDIETGEPDDDFVEFESDQLETGAPGRRRVSRRKSTSRKNLGRIARKRREGRIRGGRRGRRRIRRLGRLNRMVRNNDMTYFSVKGGSVLSSSIGMKGKLRDTEVSAIKFAVFAGVLAEPQVYTLGAGSPSQYVFDAQNHATLTGVPWIGFILTVEASRLNMVPGGDFTLSIYNSASGVATSLTTLTMKIKAGRQFMQAVVFTAGLQAGRARIIINQGLVYNATPADPPLDGITVNGLPADYTAKIRMLGAGDAEVEKLLRLL